MRILVYGAGAIGGYLGGLLAESGADVTLVARGAQYRALSTEGLTLEWAGGRSRHIRVQACQPGEAATRGRYDIVFVTLKSMQLAAAAQDIAASVSPRGGLVMIQNGLPWWYFERLESPWRGAALACLDPGGLLAKGFDLDQVIGAVIYKPVTAAAPGRLFIPAVDANKLLVGEIEDRRSERLDQIAALVSAAGLPTEITTDIRAEKWRKLLTNLVWNPLCALTRSPPGRIAEFPGGAELVRSMTREGAAVAAAVGVRIDADPEAALRRVAGNYTQQPSMLQDALAGRPLEWQAIVQAVIEIAALTSVPVPTLRNIALCLGVLDQHIREEGKKTG